jgi:MFS family permease
VTDERPWPAEEVSVGRRAYRLVLVGTLVSALGEGLTLPFLVIYLHGVLGASLPVAGVVLALSAAAQIAATIVGGRLGDRFGLGRVVLVGLVVQAAGTALLAAEAGLGVAVVGVVLLGIGGGSLWPGLNGLIALQVPPAARSRAYALRFGLLNGGLGVGGLVAGMIVSVADPGSFRVVYSVDAASTLGFALLVALGLRRTPGFGPALVRAPRAEGGRRGYRAALSDRPFAAYLVLGLAMGVFGYAQMDGPWAAFVTGDGGAGTRVVGLGFAANTAVIVALQLPVERLTRRFRRSRLMVLTCLLWTVAWIVSGLAALPGLPDSVTDVGFIASLAVFGLGETFLSPVGGVVPNELAPDALRGRYNALAGSTIPVGGLIGPPLAGLVLAGPAPASWTVLIAGGSLACAAGALVLGRLLPARVDRPAA